jgi:crotonobetainyl-CoA:carnitine CoA-transferase CaiB-like acyl-CoA transferase
MGFPTDAPVPDNSAMRAHDSEIGSGSMRFDPGATDITEADLRYVLGEIGLTGFDLPASVTIDGTPPNLNSPLRVMDGGAIALAAQAAAVASLAQMRSGPAEDITIDARQIIFNFKPFFHTLLDGRPTGDWTGLAAAAPCMGHFACADGRVVYICNLVPKLRNATLRFLNCEADREKVAAAIAKWRADELETAMTAQGIPVAVMREPDDWLRTEQGIALQSSPLVHIDRVGEVPPVALADASRPFAGIKVVDMTHVLAGPMITRGLAEYGADVLHLRSADPGLDDPKAVSTEFRLGKSTATLELTDAADRDTLRQLLSDADVFVHSWRPGVFERFGFDPQRVAALKPGIIQIAVSCYGPVGPWSDRGGFDGLALASTGATAIEARHDRPKVSPPGVVTDALVGFLGTAVVASLLQRRAREGGSYRAELSLARTAMWLLSLGLDEMDPDSPAEVGEPRMRRLAAPLGQFDLVAPAISFSSTRSQLPFAGAMPKPAWP